MSHFIYAYLSRDARDILTSRKYTGYGINDPLG